jgi:hypothetical protein
VDPLRLVKIVHEWPGATLVPPVSLKLDLEAPQPAAGNPKPATRNPKPAARGGSGRGGVSWWTARATAGEVTGGFTKEEILRKPESDPRAEGGMFSRLESLLRALT